MSRLEEIQSRANEMPRGPWGTMAQEDIEWLLREVDRLTDKIEEVKESRDHYEAMYVCNL